MGQNMNSLISCVNLKLENILQCSSKDSAHNLCHMNIFDVWHKQQNAMDLNIAHVCAELIDARDGLLECNLAKTEILDLLTHLCES